MIQLHQFPQSQVASQTAQYISKTLKKYLSDGSTLLFLSGGSVAKEVVPELLKELSQLSPQLLSGLTISLIDERFGHAWHSQSNMLLLKEVGLVAWCQKNQIDLILPFSDIDNNSLEVTAQQYDTKMQPLFVQHRGRIVGVLGLGEDGHTAGIKPQPDQETFEKLFGGGKLVVGYEWTDFTRLTLTQFALQQFTQAIVYATGEAKKDIIQRLVHDKKLKAHEFPAVLLIASSHTVDLFTQSSVEGHMA